MGKLKAFMLMGLLLTAQFLWAQTQVTGRVTDSRDGSPLTGVTVTVKNTNNSTTTDENGSFTLNAPANSRLVFSYVGFQTIERNAGSGPLSISLTQGEGGLTEVVVTGYKQRSRREFAGSAGTVSGETIRSVPIASFDQALQGQTPGLILRATSGQPGNSGSAIIRGRGSINGSNEPIYVVDGIQIAAGDFALLNPADIENVSVLKDAVASSVYGSRGGNGVIVVTTKRGKTGKPNLDFEAYTGWSRMPEFRDFRLMNTNEKIDYELRRGGTVLSSYSAARIDSLRKIETDWEDLVTRTGRTYNLMGSAAGGAEKFRYYTSVNYFKQEGTLKNTGFDRVTGRANLSQDAGNFSFGINTTGTYSNYSNTAEINATISSPLNGVQWTNPYEQEFIFGSYNAAGNFVRGGNTLARQRVTATGQPLPTTELYDNTNATKQTRLVVVGNVEYRIPFIDGLSARAVYGIDYNQDQFQAFVDRTTYSAGSNPRPISGANANFRTSSFRRDFLRGQRITSTNSLNYVQKFGDHAIDFGAYYENIEQKNANAGNTVYLLASPFRNEAGATISSDLLPVIRGGGDEARLVSYFGLLTYGFNNRYFINANLRRDGSSRFGADNKWATFWGVGASWIISDEAFMQNIKSVLSELKFKASYGTVGNQEGIGFYEAQGIVGRQVYNSVTGTTQTTLENTELQWEERKKFNTGFDYAIFNNRLRGSLEYYNETTENLFLPRPVSRTTGFTSLTVNIGSVRNSGVEFGLNGDVLRSRDIKLTFNGNITYNKNQILQLADRDSIPAGLAIRVIGQPINSIFLAEYAGVNPTNGEALYRTLDGKTTEEFDPSLKQIVGKSDPDVFGGFGFNFDFKGLALNTQFTYMLGTHVYNNERVNLEHPDYLADNVSADLLREWQRPGDITDIASPNSLFQGAQDESTRFLDNNSFVRLRNISLSYNIPKGISDAAKLRGASIYVSGTNLWVATKYRGRDPEFPGVSVTGAQYPALRTVQAGIRVNF